MNRDNILRHLLASCITNGLFDPDVRADPNVDLVDSGQIDSMGLMTLQSLVEETYNVAIPAPLFIAELRSLSKVAVYLESKMSIGRLKVVLNSAERRSSTCLRTTSEVEVDAAS